MRSLAIAPRTRRHPSSRPCVDCPASRTQCFASAIGAGASSCRLVKCTLSARAPIPASWASDHALALVRRGVLVRTRGGEHGAAVAIDCVGPGAGLPLVAARDDVGYAATDALVCLYPRAGMDDALTTERGTARDVIALISRALDRVERLAAARGGATLDARVASVIAVIAETSSPPHRRERLPTGLQQRDLARLAGVRHESFCRVLGRLECSGIVQREADGLRIHDHEALVSFGG